MHCLSKDLPVDWPLGSGFGHNCVHFKTGVSILFQQVNVNINYFLRFIAICILTCKEFYHSV